MSDADEQIMAAAMDRRWHAGYRAGQTDELEAVMMWLRQRPVFKPVMQALASGEHRKLWPTADKT